MEFSFESGREIQRMNRFLNSLSSIKCKFKISNDKSLDYKINVFQTAYAADVGPKVLEFFEKYYSIPFPLPKQDMIAIPDFSAGAMENW